MTIKSFIILLLSVLSLHRVLEAQSLSVSMRDVDFSGLPTVTLKACVQKNGALVSGLKTTSFTLLENNTPQQIRARCPDPNQINSVVLVLDNSGSMFPVMSKLIEAAGRLVDSLGANDECAILVFGRTVAMVHDFSTDKVSLNAALQTLTASGGTPLFDASYEAVNALSLRTGNRHAVIITDGEDNTSTKTVDEVIALALVYSVKLYTIAFNIEVQNQRIMERMAIETGGSFFVVERPSELNAVYERIAAQITEKCCILEYESTSCVDTLRTLFLAVVDSGLFASDVQSFTSPSRAAFITLELDVPPSLSPLASGMGFITMTPSPSLLLQLNLSFTLTYDPQLVDILPTLPFTLGTVVQNQVVSMVKVAPGELRFTLSGIKPALQTNRLIGFPIQALLADSSRKVPFGIKDIALEGCPSIFGVIPDSTVVCQCMLAADVRMPPAASLTPNESLRLPVSIGSGLSSSVTLLGEMRITLPEFVDLLGVEDGSLLPSNSFDWSLSGRTLTITLRDGVVPKDTAGVFVTLVLRPWISDSARTFTLSIQDIQFWQRCCPLDDVLPEFHFVSDGICQAVVSKKNQAAMRIIPHPVRQGVSSTLFVDIPDAVEDVTAYLIDAGGKVVQVLSHVPLSTGKHQLPLRMEQSPSGQYSVLLMNSQSQFIKSFVLVK